MKWLLCTFLLVSLPARAETDVDDALDNARWMRASGVVLLERLPERAHPFTSSLFLRELPHLHFG